MITKIPKKSFKITKRNIICKLIHFIIQGYSNIPASYKVTMPADIRPAIVVTPPIIQTSILLKWNLGKFDTFKYIKATKKVGKRWEVKREIGGRRYFK